MVDHGGEGLSGELTAAGLAKDDLGEGEREGPPGMSQPGPPPPPPAQPLTGRAWLGSSPAMYCTRTVRLRTEPWRLLKLRQCGYTYSRFLRGQGGIRGTGGAGLPAQAWPGTRGGGGGRRWPHSWGTEGGVWGNYGHRARDVTGREWGTGGHPQSIDGGTVQLSVGTQRDSGGTEAWGGVEQGQMGAQGRGSKKVARAASSQARAPTWADPPLPPAQGPDCPSPRRSH